MNAITPKTITKACGENNWYELTLEVNTNKPSVFTVKFNHTSINDINFQAAADIAARNIANEHDNLFIGLSGGVDSEFVANVFLRNNIKFTPIIAIMPKSHEHYHAFYWCYKNNITPIVCDLNNELDCLRETAVNMLKKFPTHDVIFGTITAYIIEKAKKLGGIAVISEPDITPKDSSKTVPYNFNLPIGNILDTDLAGHVSDLLFNDSISFLWRTPELVLSTARELNPLINFDIARAELYQVPYRPKYLQVETTYLTQNDLNTMYRVFQLNSYSRVPNIKWTRDELISILSR
jgi:hypothetical protein